MVKSESLVGLFTCVFVRQSEFRNVRETAISTVKTGMGGRYGNKGAVIARMVIDDTRCVSSSCFSWTALQALTCGFYLSFCSICFTNCHLAAGQTHVKQRNADVADVSRSSFIEGMRRKSQLLIFLHLVAQILESPTVFEDHHADPAAYVGGGDGSMILDHELCILSGDLNCELSNLTRDNLPRM